MNNELEFEDFDEGFEDFDDDLNLEGFDNETKTETRTVILFKNDMIALLGMRTAHQGGTICRVDPRERMPAVQVYKDAEAVTEWFNKSLKTSRKNGWNIAYDGLPLFG